MANETPTPPDGYDTWLDFVLSPDADIRRFTLSYARAELSVLRTPLCPQMRITLRENPKFAVPLLSLLKSTNIGFTPTHCVLGN